MLDRSLKRVVVVTVVALTLGGTGLARATGRPGASAEAAMLRAYTTYVRSLNANAAIPAFARKYGLRCSACHTAWPELSAFGQRFKDNGYQLGNDRDSPIFQNNAYWPIAMRTTPQYRVENTTNQVTD